MGLHTETEGILGDEERKFLSTRKEEEVLPVRNAATELAASLTWLPDRDSSETFSTRCQALLRAVQRRYPTGWMRDSKVRLIQKI